MRNLLIASLIVLLCQQVFTNCANPQAPTGGPKDTIPPTLLEANPAIGTINFQGQEIELEFDEPVKADRLQSSLIVTPRQEVKFKTLTKKNKLILKFDQPFPDSTTVTLNFLNGVTDITENNPAVNLSYVFSTGSFLDSLSISGKTFTLMDNKQQEDVTIGLYQLTDSLDLQKDKPTYFIKSDEEGTFKISNIKNGSYRLLAFKDLNNNLTFEGKEEAFGFLSDTIHLNENLTNIQLPLVKQNVSNLRLISSRLTTHYFDIRYSKSLAAIQLEPAFDYLFNLETSTLKLYKPNNLNYGDSLQTIFTALDSIGNESIDTLYVKFNESNKKKTAFESTLLPKESKNLPLIHYQLSFTKPVIEFNPSLISFKRDSTITIPIDSTTQFNWNDNQTLLTFDYRFDTASYYQQQKWLYDSLVDLRKAQLDTIPKDTLSKQPAFKEFKRTNTVSIVFDKETFVSIEQDTLEAIDKRLTFYSQKDLGQILLNLSGFNDTDIVQLIDKGYKMIQEQPYSSKIIFNHLPPGEYGFRVLIDSNMDGNWSQGNLLKNIEPEEVFVYPEFTSLRANWINDINISNK